VSFDNRLPATLEIVRVRIGADDVDLMAYEQAVMQFLAEVEVEVEKVLAAGQSNGAAA